jgi:hypothetical protein
LWAGLNTFNGSFCEYGNNNNELSDSIKAEDLLDQLSNYECLKEHAEQWDITPYCPLKAKVCLLPASSYFLVWLALQP